MRRRIVVIGATGHVGTYLVPRLVRAGHHVVALSASSGKVVRSWHPQADALLAALQPSELAIPDTVLSLLGPRPSGYDGPVNNHDFKNFEFKADVIAVFEEKEGLGTTHPL